MKKDIQKPKKLPKKKLPFTAQDLREADPKRVKEALSQLSEKQLKEIHSEWEFWARPEQLEPAGDWNIWFINAGRGFGKQIRKDTEILTHNRGWTTVGDLVVGDFVYDEKGKPQEVLAFYESAPDTVYEIEFDTGEVVVADAEHLWTTETHYKDRKRRVGIIPDDWGLDQSKVKTTQEIVDTFTYGSRKDLNHSIPCAKPFVGVKRTLPIDPYVFGLWLGDGHSNTGSFTNADPDIWKRLAKTFDLTFYTDITANARGFVTELRKLGLVKNKHIPEIYMDALVEDRIELLRGLMDSDGYVDPTNGCAEFCQNGSNPLADQVLELVCGLGMKARLYTGRATIRGKDCGPKYRVCWTVRDINPFWLPRKAEVAEKFLQKKTGQVNRNRQRMLRSFRKVDTPECGLRCLTVTGDSNLFLISRSFIPTHNTRAGVEWVRSQIKKGKRRIAAVASTNSDIERVMVKGESGFLTVCSETDKTERGVHLGFPEWSPTKRTLTWANGAKVEFYSAEEPERLRGPQFEAAWTDELAAWNKDIDTWDMLQFCLRLGKHPRICVTTTPKPTKLVRNILKGAEPQEDGSPGKVHVTTGSTFDNAANLASTYLKAVKAQYEGTRLGRQELYAEVLEEAEGALWTTDTLDKSYILKKDVPDLVRVVVALDPAVTSNAESDMTGIVVAGVDVNGYGYILGDYTDKLSPQGWALKAIELYHQYEADRIVAEVNQGGDMVKQTIRGEDETVPYKAVRASRGKYARAEPISALYERGLVKHVQDPDDGANLNELETQMRTWEPLGSIGSPDRLDAMVWALTELMMNGVTQSNLKMKYEPKGAISTKSRFL